MTWTPCGRNTRGCRVPARAVKAGRRPPIGEALRARSHRSRIMVEEARQGFLSALPVFGDEGLGTPFATTLSSGQRFVYALPMAGAPVVGMAEVASIIGVSRQRVFQLARDYPDFPEPVAVLASGRVWERAAVEAWSWAHPDRRPGRPRRPSDGADEVSGDEEEGG